MRFRYITKCQYSLNVIHLYLPFISYTLKRNTNLLVASVPASSYMVSKKSSKDILRSPSLSHILNTLSTKKIQIKYGQVLVKRCHNLYSFKPTYQLILTSELSIQQESSSYQKQTNLHLHFDQQLETTQLGRQGTSKLSESCQQLNFHLDKPSWLQF